MNAGYSSGWCEESFGLPLVACEILCTARGDDRCRFVMAPPERIEARIQAYSRSEPGIAARAGNYEIPDLFARRRAEEALRASEAKYRALVEMTETGFLILDGEGRVVDANDEYVRLSGHRAQAEILGRSVLEWTDGASREKNAAAIAQALRDRSVRGLEIDYVDGQGRTTPVEIDATVEGEGDGLRIISLCRDITDRRRAEAALRESEERFRQVAQIVEEFVWEVDAAGRYTYANPVVEKVLGYRPEELVGKKHFSDLFPPAEREALRRKALEVFARRESFRRFVNENLHRDGHRVMLETSAVPLLDAAGNLLGYRGADRDVTEHEQLERSRRERLAELEEFQSVMLGRESRIVEMKEEVNDLLRQLGRPRKYDI
jgi:PAS domain S-box-containing protein